MSCLPSLLNQLMRLRPRICALTSKNKILMVYFGALVLARLASALATPFVKPPIVPDIPPIPLDIFNFCGVLTDLDPMLIPSSIGTAFGTCWIPSAPSVFDHVEHLELSAFLVIALYTYSNKRALKFSAVVSTIVSEATIYFLAMVAVQTFIQISMNVMEVRSLSRFPLRFVIAEPNASGSR